MTRVVLDTDVIVSALLFRGVCNPLHALWRRGGLSLLVSEVSIAELTRVLACPKFRLSAETVAGLVASEVLPFTQRILPVRSPPICRDPKDDEFLWCARDGRAELLVTGDPDLFWLGLDWSGIPIVSVSRAVELLIGQ